MVGPGGPSEASARHLLPGTGPGGYPAAGGAGHRHPLAANAGDYGALAVNRPVASSNTVSFGVRTQPSC